jgi:hypothetical protein
MIAKDERTLGEFYVAPVYTSMYQKGLKRIETCNIGLGMHGLGTPNDLSIFLQHPVLDKALGHSCEITA